MKSKRYPWLVLPILLAGCAIRRTAEPALHSWSQDLPDLMSTVVDPAADVYWDAVGWIIDASGTTEIRPESPEEWEAVRNAAYQVAESGNLMMMRGRAVDEPEWTAFLPGDHQRRTASDRGGGGPRRTGRFRRGGRALCRVHWLPRHVCG